MDYVTAVLQLIGGLGAFLIAFNILSESVEKLANTGLKKLFTFLVIQIISAAQIFCYFRPVKKTVCTHLQFPERNTDCS